MDPFYRNVQLLTLVKKNKIHKFTGSLTLFFFFSNKKKIKINEGKAKKKKTQIIKKT